MIRLTPRVRDTDVDAPGAGSFTSAELALRDPSNLWHRIVDLPDQAERAWLRGSTWTGVSAMAVERVVVMGMGGSAIGAQLATRIVQQRSPVAIEVVRDAQLPVMTDRTLLVLCSFSGETEEVLSALDASRGKSGATVVITRGGALYRAAVAEGVPALVYEYEGEPRSAIGYGTMLLLGLLYRVGVFPTGDDEMADVIREVRESADAYHPSIPPTDNPARALAQQIGSSIPVILADASIAAAAVRWQNQCNENSKRWAFSGTVPEVMHNLVEGLDQRGSRSFHVILLEDLSRSHTSRARLDVLQQHLSEARVASSRFSFHGTTDLSTLLQACVLGDWVSYYLALDADIDPSPVPAISRLKQRVAARMLPTIGRPE